MFSALNPGSQVYILDKKDTPTLLIGEVVSKTEPVPTYNSFGANYNDSKINLTIKTDNGQMELKNVGANLSIMSDPTNGIFMTETREAMETEINNQAQISQKHIAAVPYHEKAIVAYDEMLKTLSPRYAEDKRRDEDIAGLKNRQDAMDEKLDKILNAVMNK